MRSRCPTWVRSLRSSGRGTTALRIDAAADGRNVVFGEVVEGLDVLDKIESTYTQHGEPVDSVVIAACGELE